MYDRRVKGETLTFAVSGLLWEFSLVMIDKETRSYWSHLLGKAMRGKLTGTELVQIPSVLTDWKSWRKTHPTTTLAAMTRTVRDYDRQSHARHDQLLIGLVLEGRARGWKLKALRDHPLVHDRLGGTPVVVIYDRINGTAVLHGRKIGQQVLTFRWNDQKLIDQQTASEWDILTGKAVSGPLKGNRLPSEPGIISVIHAWEMFHPASTFWKPSPSASRSSD